MRRRTFLEMAALGALHRFSPPAFAGAPAPTDSNAASPDFGSGHFGQWIRDEFGLPAFRYTCDQTTDPLAELPVNEAWRSKTDHIHQFGNDRVVVVASNYGYVQVRQDEGSPKFLNDYLPKQQRYGGGIGYLVDSSVVLGTHFPSTPATRFDRIFGTGYLRKTLESTNYAVDQVVFAPFGDDPVVISQVTITNRSATVQRPRWIECWGAEAYQYSYRALMEGSVTSNADAAPQLRRDFSRRFEPRFNALPGQRGLVLRPRFLGRSAEEEALWQKLQASLAANPHGYFGGPVPPLAPGASMEDTTLPPTFLVSLDAPAHAVSTNATAFFADGPEHPHGARVPLDNTLDKGADRAFLLERQLELAPGESRTLRFLYGYLPEGFTLEALQRRYEAEPASHLSASSTQWKASFPSFRIPSQPWVEREIAWNYGYLRSGLTYDSFFREHILSQGAGYQYLAGLQGAARDPLQHALPLIFTDPAIVRGILRYTLREIQPDGSIPYGIVGCGVPMPCRYRPSDLELWVLWLASEYVLATRDTSFLAERVATYPASPSQPKQTILDLLDHCFGQATEKIGTGEHGLQRLYNGDWNDSIVVNRLSPEQVADIMQHGESVLNAAMATWVFDEYARLLRLTGHTDRATAATRKAEEQRTAVRKQWTGTWFRRAWLGKELGWSGEKQLWLEPQPWAILGGCTSPEQTQTLVQSIDEMSRRKSAIGALLQSPADPTMKDEPGNGTNGGIFAAINATLIWALAEVDGAMAWDEWKKNTFAIHAANYPGMWFGTWSGPDAYDSFLARKPGSTSPDFPVLNMHSHAWPFYTATKLLGLRFHEHGLDLKPVLPEPQFEFSSPLFGLHKSAPGQYAGWYEPSSVGSWSIAIELPPAELASVRELRVNGAPAPIQRRGGAIAFEASSRPGHPLRWELR